MATDPAAGDDDADQRARDEQPPFLGSWRGVYALVLGALGALILACSIVSAVYK
jgi:hypothetical protein